MALRPEVTPLGSGRPGNFTRKAIQAFGIIFPKSKHNCDSMGQIIDSILAPARPDGLLFHYTTQKGLLGILESKAIWATHIRYLNDGAEFWHTLELAQTELEMRKRVNARNGELIEMIEQLISHISASVPEVYVTSFSTKQDQLSQWRAYCPRGGFCLGFEADIIHSYAEKERFILSQCVYDKNIQSGAIALLKRMVSPRLRPSPL